MHSATVHYCGSPERPLMIMDITLSTAATMPRIWLLPYLACEAEVVAQATENDPPKLYRDALQGEETDHGADHPEQAQ
jgi:hypothetical protein